MANDFASLPTDALKATFRMLEGKLDAMYNGADGDIDATEAHLSLVRDTLFARGVVAV